MSIYFCGGSCTQGCHYSFDEPSLTSSDTSANSVMRGRVHARRTLKGLVADLRIDSHPLHVVGEDGYRFIVMYFTLPARNSKSSRYLS